MNINESHSQKMFTLGISECSQPNVASLTWLSYELSDKNPLVKVHFNWAAVGMGLRPIYGVFPRGRATPNYDITTIELQGSSTLTWSINYPICIVKRFDLLTAQL